MEHLLKETAGANRHLITARTAFLVVDDFEPMRKVTSGQLRLMGASNIVTANNGIEALRILQKQRIDIVLSDWNMPVMSGLDLLKAVRADEKLCALPFIMITAEAERHRIDEAIATGVSDLLVKPYTADRLATHVEKALAAPPRVRPKSHAVVPLPAAASVAASMPPESHDNRPEPTERSTILVVDDVPDNLLLLTNLLKNDYRIRIANSGPDALAICHSNEPPDLVLLDIMMPGMDGFEVATRMREHPTSVTIPVIFVTAMTDNDARLKGMELGAVDFVTKPIDPAALMLRVRNFMRYVSLHKQLQADYEDIQALAHLREDVDQIMRHDLKGPLAGVIGLVQELANDPTLDRKQSGQLRIIEETAFQVLDMVNLSAELYKIETGRFELAATPIGLAGILQRVVDISRATFADKQITIAIDTDVPVGVEAPKALADAMLCYSLFQNLIKNACEAAPENSRINVTLYNETPLRVTIQNVGAVPAEIRADFFGKFVTFGKEGGTGLGTYSARMLTEAQNGTIALEINDAENQTVITVTLPRHSPPPP